MGIGSNLLGRAAELGEGVYMAAEDRGELLVRAEPAPRDATVAERAKPLPGVNSQITCLTSGASANSTSK
jgi:hypothetical protein